MNSIPSCDWVVVSTNTVVSSSTAVVVSIVVGSVIGSTVVVRSSTKVLYFSEFISTKV